MQKNLIRKSFGLAPVNSGKTRHRILVGTPTLGRVRIEWHNATTGFVVPCNWSNSMQTPIGYLTHDAQNIIAHEALVGNFEWMGLIEDDTIPPMDLFLRWNKYMQSGKYPIVSGLYYLKTTPPEPLVYRGRGNGPFTKWKRGDLVMCDGVPTGCILINMKIIREVAKISKEYTVRAGGNERPLLKIFDAPRDIFTDPELPTYYKNVGTSDLVFCDLIMQEGILAKAGWKKLAKEKYPFLIDTNILCTHIDENGKCYP